MSFLSGVLHGTYVLFFLAFRVSVCQEGPCFYLVIYVPERALFCEREPSN